MDPLEREPVLQARPSRDYDTRQAARGQRPDTSADQGPRRGKDWTLLDLPAEERWPDTLRDPIFWVFVFCGLVFVGMMVIVVLWT